MNEDFIIDVEGYLNTKENEKAAKKKDFVTPLKRFGGKLARQLKKGKKKGKIYGVKTFGSTYKKYW